MKREKKMIKNDPKLKILNYKDEYSDKAEINKVFHIEFGTWISMVCI
jgi:hypothetical protein